MTHYFVTVAGNIGVGKSTLVRLLSQRQQWEAVYEAVSENPYLSDFYGDMRRWSFHSQTFFLARRLQQHRALMQRTNSVLQDRSVYEDAEIFARNLHRQGNMSDRDWSVYYDLFQTLTTLLPAPDLIIYLRASVPTLQARIAQRGRAFERTVSAEYLSQLNVLYDDWASRFTLSPILAVETDNLNYIRYDDHLDHIWHAVEHKLKGKDTITLSG